MKDNLFEIYCSTTHEKLFSLMSKLYAKRFSELLSDWPKCFWGPRLEVIEILNAFYLILQGFANKMSSIA